LSLTGDHTTAAYSIDARTLRVGSIAITNGNRSIVEHVHTLSVAPVLYSPSPTCGS
jgi:hypothetical protein